MPHGPKPGRLGQMTVLKDRTRSHRHLVSALATAPAGAPNRPRRLSRAPRTHPTGGPAHRGKIAGAGLIAAEALLQLQQSPRIILAHARSNSYRCPAGQQLNYGGRNLRNRTYAYIGTRKRCGACPLKAQCTRGGFRFLAIHMDEPARQRARDLASTPEFAHAQRQRKKVEALFAELKHQIGLRRLRLRPMILDVPKGSSGSASAIAY